MKFSLLGAVFLSFSFSLSIVNYFLIRKLNIKDLYNILKIQNTSIVTSFAFLVMAFVTNDFCLDYVSSNSNTSLSLYYKISAAWGGHSGSLLLWIAILSIITNNFLKYKCTYNLLELKTFAYILNIITSGILFILIIISNPFYFNETLIEGQGFNPLLQDYAQAIHPPILYFGYLAITLLYIISCTGMQTQRYSIKHIKLYSYVALSFLTLGILLGSMWAYRVIGWGGWWFWDFVENISLIPWILMIAVIHNLNSKSKSFETKCFFTHILICLSFISIIFGTAVIRGGLVESVHTFAVDTKVGASFFILLLACSCPGIYIAFKNKEHLSNSTLFIKKNKIIMLLVLMCLFLFLSLLSPIILTVISKAFLNKNIIVSEDFYSSISSFITSISSLLLVVYLYKKNRFTNKKILALIGLFGIYLLYAKLYILLLSLVLLLYLLGELYYINKRGNNDSKAYIRLLSHAGFLIAAIAIYVGGSFSTQHFLNIDQKQAKYINKIELTLAEQYFTVRNNHAAIVVVAKLKNMRTPDKFIKLNLEKRSYINNESTYTTTRIYRTILKDYIFILGEKLDDGSWQLEIIEKAGQSFIWFGVILIIISYLLKVTFLWKNEKKIVS